MRIISGKYKGKKLNAYDIEGTRPTMNRVKESLFGMIQSYVPDAVVLDLFAGSGSLGIEAISNGAKRLVLTDNNKKITDILKDTTKSFNDDILILNIDYKKYLKETNEKFDIIFLDPPYRADLMNKALRIIEEREILNKGGIVVCEFENIKIETNLELIKEKSYGPKTIQIYRS
ncbi:MAG: 16S rRNA (guanine(966)-N(2))-methyltransferase RsmD [Bacilli bacterium]|nr:16S rRNA (guanine(966)-N(2))-methyltransferase RsmD [Bacilli bacterium]